MKSKLAYWIPTVLFCLLTIPSGTMNLLAVGPVPEAIAHLGFPTWFPHWLGFWKLAGVAVILLPGLPRLKEWAYAGFLIVLSSACVSHIAASDPVGNAIAPIVSLTLAMLSWYFRPESRKLPGKEPAARLEAIPAK